MYYDFYAAFGYEISIEIEEPETPEDSTTTEPETPEDSTTTESETPEDSTITEPEIALPEVNVVMISEGQSCLSDNNNLGNFKDSDDAEENLRACA
jgi:hypothetical protein